MATQTFPRFNNLCPEIRTLIWDFATRPHGIRGVQHFSIFPCYSDLAEFDGHIAPILETGQKEVVGAPSTIHSTTGGSYNNHSTYTIDSGLWTACRESRAAVFRRYRPDEWAEFYDSQKKKYNPKREPDRGVVHLSSTFHDMPATFAMSRGENKKYFTILPATDLIFLHPNLHPMSMRRELWNLSKELPFASSKLGFGGMCHIALEFDPSWSIAELVQYHRECTSNKRLLSRDRWNMYNMLVSTAMDYYTNGHRRTLWLVDRRLRRKHLAPTADELKEILRIESMPEEERTVFHENGCRYLGTPARFNQRWLWAYEDDEPGSAEKSRQTVWKFVERLNSVATFQAWYFSNGLNDTYLENVRPWRPWRVLLRST